LDGLGSRNLILVHKGGALKLKACVVRQILNCGE